MSIEADSERSAYDRCISKFELDVLAIWQPTLNANLTNLLSSIIMTDNVTESRPN